MSNRPYVLYLNKRLQTAKKYTVEVTDDNFKNMKRPIQLTHGIVEKSAAQEKLNRQMQYSREIAAASRDAISLHVDSITRIVVQKFRKVINCERCALFLMDNDNEELYFKPVGDANNKVIQEIRFPVTSGVAGWVARNKKTANIKDAYKDPRFYKTIDQHTKFVTKSILCMPVFSSHKYGFLLGVIQMLNKLTKGSTRNTETIGRGGTTNKRQFFDR